MGRPRRSKSKTRIEVAEPIGTVTGGDPVSVVATAEGDIPAGSEDAVFEVVGGKKVRVEKLGPGQRYFEAPDGRVLIGDATVDRIWYRAGNGGQGMWINPKR